MPFNNYSFKLWFCIKWTACWTFGSFSILLKKYFWPNYFLHITFKINGNQTQNSTKMGRAKYWKKGIEKVEKMQSLKENKARLLPLPYHRNLAPPSSTRISAPFRLSFDQNVIELPPDLSSDHNQRAPPRANKRAQMDALCKSKRRNNRVTASSRRRYWASPRDPQNPQLLQLDHLNRAPILTTITYCSEPYDTAIYWPNLFQWPTKPWPNPFA